MKRHVCGLDCLKVKGGELYHACKVCKHGSEIPIARSSFFGRPSSIRSRTLGYSAYEHHGNPQKSSRTPLTSRERTCASLIVPRMIREQKKGRWKSRRQAIAVALSKARKEC